MPAYQSLAHTFKLHVTNLNTTLLLLLDRTDGQQLLNAIYTVRQMAAMLEHPEVMEDCHHAHKVIYHLYKLPNIDPMVRYLYAATGFPTKAIWPKVTRSRNYICWPLINTKNVNKSPPDSKEMRNSHTRGQWQGTHSSQPSSLPSEEKIDRQIKPVVKN